MKERKIWFTIASERQEEYCRNGYIIQTCLEFNAIPSEILMTFFTQLEKQILKFIWKQIRSKPVRTGQSRMVNAEDITMLGSSHNTEI